MFQGPTQNSLYSARAAGIRESAGTQLIGAGREGEFRRAQEAASAVGPAPTIRPPESALEKYLDRQAVFA